MEKYSRSIIEEYCINHPRTKKAEFLWEMVHLSQLISREKNLELREALEDLGEFMNGY